MKVMSIIYKLWLTITAIDVASLNLTLFNIRLLQSLKSSNLQNNLNQQASDEFSEIIGQNSMVLRDLQVEFAETKVRSQLDSVRKRNIIRVAVIGKKAYWIHNNVFYEADVVDGHINNEGAKVVDAFNLSAKELDDLLEILDHIRS